MHTAFDAQDFNQNQIRKALVLTSKDENSRFRRENVCPSRQPGHETQPQK